MSHTEPEKSGLPRVLAHIEVSCKSRLGRKNNISELVKKIWDKTTEEQMPGERGVRLEGKEEHICGERGVRLRGRNTDISCIEWFNCSGVLSSESCHPV